jgi:hypothetical protein
MGVFIIAILMPVLAQADQAKESDVYEITPTEGGGERYFATIESNTTDSLKLRVYDGSNRGNSVTVNKSAVKINYIGSKLADKEIAKRLDEVSKVINGIRVPNDEFNLSQRARTLANDLEARLAIPDPTPVDSAVDTSASPVDPGPLAMRGPAIGLILGAVVLVGIIVKLVILG